MVHDSRYVHTSLRCRFSYQSRSGSTNLFHSCVLSLLATSDGVEGAGVVNTELGSMSKSMSSNGRYLNPYFFFDRREVGNQNAIRLECTQTKRRDERVITTYLLFTLSEDSMIPICCSEELSHGNHDCIAAPFFQIGPRESFRLAR